MTVVCIASGPSLTRADVDYCRGKAKVYVVNDGYRLATWAQVLYAADHRWWISTPVGQPASNEVMSRGMRDRVTCDPGTAEKFGLRYVPHEPGAGLGSAPWVRGTNSGEEVLNLAANENEGQRVLLLGYDMGATGTGHWFGDHPDEIEIETPHGSHVEKMNTTTPAQFAEWVQEFEVIAAQLKARGIEVINCTRTTALRCFPQRAIEECL